jgi:hypothetical protein
MLRSSSLSPGRSASHSCFPWRATIRALSTRHASSWEARATSARSRPARWRSRAMRSSSMRSSSSRSSSGCVPWSMASMASLSFAARSSSFTLHPPSHHVSRIAHAGRNLRQRSGDTRSRLAWGWRRSPGPIRGATPCQPPRLPVGWVQRDLRTGAITEAAR